MGDNDNPCPTDKPYISLDNKVETEFILLSLQRYKVVFDKTIAAQANFVIFNFLENDNFFLNSVESLDFLIR